MKLATRHRTDSGFKRSEMAFLAVVLLLVLAFGLPIYEQRRREMMRKECITNLKHIDGAAHQWSLEYGKLATDTYSLTDPTVLAFLRGSLLPVCPAGGVYTPAPNVGSWSPLCNIPGHTL